jgi:hypothetical protein
VLGGFRMDNRWSFGGYGTRYALVPWLCASADEQASAMARMGAAHLFEHGWESNPEGVDRYQLVAIAEELGLPAIGRPMFLVASAELRQQVSQQISDGRLLVIPEHRLRPADETAFENAIHALESEIANAGTHLIIDSSARQQYARSIKALADEIRAEALSGKITWSQGAERAHECRNIVMELVRGQSSPVGRAIAQDMKRKGRTLNELIARKTMEVFGSAADFNRLTPAQKNTVYAAIVDSAGTSRAKVTSVARALSPAGKGLLVLSLALSVYAIATADDKLRAAGHEVVVTGASIGGGLAGGALAGLACGPGAPVCVTLGAFVGGAMAAFGVDLLW